MASTRECSAPAREAQGSAPPPKSDRSPVRASAGRLLTPVPLASPRCARGRVLSSGRAPALPEGKWPGSQRRSSLGSPRTRWPDLRLRGARQGSAARRRSGGWGARPWTPGNTARHPCRRRDSARPLGGTARCRPLTMASTSFGTRAQRPPAHPAPRAEGGGGARGPLPPRHPGGSRAAQGPLELLVELGRWPAPRSTWNRSA